MLPMTTWASCLSHLFHSDSNFNTYWWWKLWVLSILSFDNEKMQESFTIRLLNLIMEFKHV
jgi:hypothetical protein